MDTINKRGLRRTSLDFHSKQSQLTAVSARDLDLGLGPNQKRSFREQSESASQKDTNNFPQYYPNTTRVRLASSVSCSCSSCCSCSCSSCLSTNSESENSVSVSKPSLNPISISKVPSSTLVKKIRFDIEGRKGKRDHAHDPGILLKRGNTSTPVSPSSSSSSSASGNSSKDSGLYSSSSVKYSQSFLTPGKIHTSSKSLLVPSKSFNNISKKEFTAKKPPNSVSANTATTISRSVSFKKLLTKSKSFVFRSSSKDKEKEKQSESETNKYSQNTLPLPSTSGRDFRDFRPTSAAKWLEGFPVNKKIVRNQEICNSCGGYGLVRSKIYLPPDAHYDFLQNKNKGLSSQSQGLPCSTPTSTMDNNYYYSTRRRGGGTGLQQLDDNLVANYDCRIPRPKLKFLVPTHSHGVTKGFYGTISTTSCSNTPTKRTATFRGKIEISDCSGFTEISLSDNDNDNDDAAYGTGSGSSSSKSSSSKYRSSDETLSEFEKEQEQSHFDGTSRRLLTLRRSLWSSRSSSLSKGNGSTTTAASSRKDSSRILEFLKTLPSFRKLGSAFLTKLISDHVKEVNFDCGEYILRQGRKGEGLFILTVGTAKATFTSSKNGEEIYLRTFHPGDVFGPKGKGNQEEKINKMNVQTTDETATCLIVSEEGLDLIVSKSPEMRNRFCDNGTQLGDFFERVELEDLRLISTLGIGGFGRVELVTLKTDRGQSFALKQMKKCQIVATRQIAHIKSEKSILLETNCDFITKLYKTFKDGKYLYMLMEPCLGGELWTILRDRGHFGDPTARFYVGCVLEALKYLHAKNIIYRDLKPENLLLDAQGYLKLVDFGFAKRLESSKTWTFCGTPEYVAPEVILNKGHGLTADYWSLGVLMFELLTGTPPFVGGDPMRTYKLILKGMDLIQFPETVSKSAHNLIRKLCREDPQDRLGFSRGLSEIKRHKWFDGLDWGALRGRTLTPPILPCVKGPHDAGNFDEYPPERGQVPPDDLSGWDWDF